MRARYSTITDFRYEHIVNDCIEYIIKPIVEKIYTTNPISIRFTYGPDQSSTIEIVVIGEFSFYVSGFPGNCGWLVVHDLTRYPQNRKLMIDISISIARYMRFVGIFVSHYVSQYTNDYLGPWKELGGTIVVEGYNLHSNNNIECVYVPIDYQDGDCDENYEEDEDEEDECNLSWN